MKRIMLLFLLITLPNGALALEQSFTQQGLKATIKLSPEKLETESRIQLSLNLRKDGTSITDRYVTLEVYEQNRAQPIIKRQVDVLDSDYVDSWKFDKSGDYKMVVRIADHKNPDEVISYEVNATVMEAGGEHGGHGMMSHHLGGGRWGWWGAGFMFIMMVPMAILLL